MKVDYSKSLVYKLCCRDPTIKDIYVGSTTSMKHRKSQHKSACNSVNGKYYNYPLYQFIRQNGDFDNWSIILLEKYPCKDKLELKKRERYWIETLKSSLNRNIPGRSQKEWYEQNREYVKKRNKKYYNENREQITKQTKEYREANREQITKQTKKYRLNNKELIKEQRKKYCIENSDKIKEYYQEWYKQKGKEKIKEYHSQKITCECGATITRGGMSTHRKTKKHQFYEQIYDFIYS